MMRAQKTEPKNPVLVENTRAGRCCGIEQGKTGVVDEAVPAIARMIERGSLRPVNGRRLGEGQAPHEADVAAMAAELASREDKIAVLREENSRLQSRVADLESMNAVLRTDLEAATAPSEPSKPMASAKTKTDK